jgi:hypothetical protein
VEGRGVGRDRNAARRYHHRWNCRAGRGYLDLRGGGRDVDEPDNGDRSDGAVLVVCHVGCDGESPCRRLRVAGCLRGQRCWTSADSGATWTKQATMGSTASLLVGPRVVSDSSGAHVVLADGEIWTSADSGATWTDQTAGTSAAAQNWVGMAADATATRLVAITAYNDIWTSADSGATWTNRTKGTAASAQAWQAVASDSTGTNLVAVAQETLTAGGIAYGLDIWTSADAGATWTNRTAGTAASGNLWWAVASNATGDRIVAVSAHGRANDVWTSADSGTTWTNETKGTPASGQQWEAVASDATGTRLVAVSANPPGGGPCCFGNIWTN